MGELKPENDDGQEEKIDDGDESKNQQVLSSALESKNGAEEKEQLASASNNNAKGSAQKLDPILNEGIKAVEVEEQNDAVILPISKQCETEKYAVEQEQLLNSN